MNVKTYSELIRFHSFKDRFRYLKLDGIVGKETFGFRRWINQELYRSLEWRSFRNSIIIRDNGCDLGIQGFEIYGSVLIHHLNPITHEDIVCRNSCIFDPENVICTKLNTHNAIHYGDENLLLDMPKERTQNDTCLWRKSQT